MALTGLVERVVGWINKNNIPCFYAGIRADCAMDLRIAPNSAAFNAAFDMVEVSPADYGRDFMVAYIPQGM